MPSPPTDPRLRDWLAYFAEIGYGDLLLDRPASPWGAEARATPPAAARPLPRTAPTPPATATRREPALVVTAAGAREVEADTADTADRVAALAAVAALASECRACRLCEGRQSVVFGSGNVGAELMFIGEGPGADEDRQGLPFVGKAGELLTKIIGAIGRTRDGVYIANIVKCRPPGNRDPQPDEVAACRGFLEQQIDLVRPRAIVLLGRVAAQTLLGNETSISRLRGRWYEVRGVPARVTYHPAALLRAPDLKRPTWDDLQQVRDRLATV